MSVSGYSLDCSEINAIKEIFYKLDKNQNGSISVSELGLAIRVMGADPTEEDIKRMIAKCDADSNGSIELREFVTLMRTIAKDRIVEEDVQEAFSNFDTNKDGFLTIDEINETMKRFGEPLTKSETDMLMDDFDKDRDGKINLSEFMDLINGEDHSGSK